MYLLWSLKILYTLGKKENRRGIQEPSFSFKFYAGIEILDSLHDTASMFTKEKKNHVFWCFFFTALLDFLSRARTMEHLEEYSRYQKFADAKHEDKNLLMKQRSIRIQVTYVTLL